MSGEVFVERRNSTRLKSVETLAREFSELIVRIEQAGSMPLLLSALRPLIADPSFAELQGQLSDLIDSAESRVPLFLSWSTGHKIALHVIVQLVANARPRSLVLFDEPEAHLHPPLMAALMHAVRLVLTSGERLLYRRYAFSSASSGDPGPTCSDRTSSGSSPRDQNS